MTLQQLLFTLHLIVIALGIGLTASNFINTRLALGNGTEHSKGLGLQRHVISRFGDAVIALIWVTGLVLLSMRGTESLPPAFHAKLAFVVLLTLLHGFGRATGGKMRRSGDLALLPRLSQVTLLGWLSAVAALVCAVLAFHT
jgi:uncharacterized membrane protein